VLLQSAHRPPILTELASLGGSSLGPTPSDGKKESLRCLAPLPTTRDKNPVDKCALKNLIIGLRVWKDLLKSSNI